MAIISQLPGKAFELWLLIRYRTDLTGKSEIALPSELLKEWGIRRDAKADGLRRLVEAGEIQIEHQQGHSAKVKLINARWAGQTASKNAARLSKKSARKSDRTKSHPETVI
jgi:hypothetical protein